MDITALLQGKHKLLPFTIPGTLNLARLNPIPHRYRPGRRRFRQKHNLAYSHDDITSLQTSLNVLESVRAIRNHRWTVFDLQYPFLASLVLFCLYIAPPAPILKTLGALAGILILMMPATQQFFLPSLTIWTWLLYFFCSRFIPAEYRPHIWVRVLPALENVLYGANLSNLLSAHVHPILDVLAWLPYGILHFGLPLICSLLLFVFAAPGTAPVFARAFGWMNILGVTIQLFFPCTPPWYENEHGLAPAAYGMPGSPAGLARVDKIFGVDMYTTNFTEAPLPFGAFPSLHSANAVLEALFMSYCFPQYRRYFIMYVGWIWWSTMYLSHHYAVDLVGGALIAASAYYLSKLYYVPRIQTDKFTRWEYEYVEYGERTSLLDEEFGSFALGSILERRKRTDSDEWTVGSSSCMSSSSGSGSGSISPTPSEDLARPGLFMLEVTPNGSVWDGNMERHEGHLAEVAVVA